MKRFVSFDNVLYLACNRSLNADGFLIHHRSRKSVTCSQKEVKGQACLLQKNILDCCKNSLAPLVTRYLNHFTASSPLIAWDCYVGLHNRAEISIQIFGWLRGSGSHLTVKMVFLWEVCIFSSISSTFKSKSGWPVVHTGLNINLIYNFSTLSFQLIRKNEKKRHAQEGKTYN